MRVIVVIIYLLFIYFSLTHTYHMTYERISYCEQDLENKENIKGCIKEVFGKDGDTMIAIAYAESNLDPHAINYNCKYGNKYTYCKKGDEKKAWSKDSGLFQINSVHTKKDISIKENILLAHDIYKIQDFNAWYSYRSGKFIDFLD